MNPLPGSSHRILTTTRALVLTFFDQIVEQGRVTDFPEDVPVNEVFVNVFPLGDNPPIPTA